MAARERGQRAEITLFPEGAFAPDKLDQRPVARIRLVADAGVPRQIRVSGTWAHACAPLSATLVEGGSGDADQLTPPERSREIASLIPRARLVMVPRCGHMLTMERPDVVNAVLREWLPSVIPAEARN